MPTSPLGHSRFLKTSIYLVQLPDGQAMNYALQSTCEHVCWYTAWWENETKWTGSARRGNVAVDYWNEVARFTQTAFVIATDIRGGFGMNGGHCKPAESIPRNAYKIKFMVVLLGCYTVLCGKWVPTFRNNLGGLVEYVHKKRREPATRRHTPL
jgi:hypothetical protein